MGIFLIWDTPRYIGEIIEESTKIVRTPRLATTDKLDTYPDISNNLPVFPQIEWKFMINDNKLAKNKI